jgi:cell division septation protein DedD
MAGRKGGDGDMVLGGRHLIGIFAMLVVVLGVVFTLGYLLGRSQYDAQLNPSVEAAMRRVDGLVGKTEKAAPASHPRVADKPAASAADQPKDWDFYHSSEERAAPERLEEQPKPVAAKSKPAAAPALKPVEPKASATPISVKTTAAIPAQPEVAPAKSTVVPAKATAIVAPAQSQAQAKNGAAFRPGVPLNTPPIPAGATVLQVAALVHEADALAMAEALQQKKFPAFVLTPGDDHFYRVQVGPYADAKSANAARQGLENQGFKSIIRR